MSSARSCGPGGRGRCATAVTRTASRPTRGDLLVAGRDLGGAVGELPGLAGQRRRTALERAEPVVEPARAVGELAGTAAGVAEAVGEPVRAVGGVDQVGADLAEALQEGGRRLLGHLARDRVADLGRDGVGDGAGEVGVGVVGRHHQPGLLGVEAGRAGDRRREAGAGW